MIKKPLDLIGAAMGWGARLHATALGPDALKSYGLIPKLLKHHQTISWRDMTPEKRYSADLSLTYPESEKEIAEFSSRLSKITAESIQEGHFPIVLGGDHTIAIGTWTGIIQALEAQQHFGLIWIDAHMDAHTLETTPSKAIHGMPLAVLLGHGDPTLVNVGYEGAKCSPAHVVLIGVRSFEAGEAALLSQLNVKIFTMDDVKSRGFQSVFEESLAIVKRDTRGFGISVDLDGFDPDIAPGVGSPEPNGLTWKEVKKAWRTLAHEESFIGLEIAEYTPERDIKHRTAKLIKSLILALLRDEEPS